MISLLVNSTLFFRNISITSSVNNTHTHTHLLQKEVENPLLISHFQEGDFSSPQLTSEHDCETLSERVIRSLAELIISYPGLVNANVFSWKLEMYFFSSYLDGF